jgi:predicted phage baseplate assembly protein
VSLPTPRLDDRSFQDIVDEAKRLIPRYLPEWTDHNLSDPGVALIELYAWMTESVIFRLNQLPEVLYVKFLELFGITLFPPAAAHADLSFHLSAPVPEPVHVRAGTEVATTSAGGVEPIVFVTDHDLVIAQPHLRSALTAAASAPNRYRLAWDDLRFDGGSVICFTSLQPDDAIYFGFQESLARNILRLDVTAGALGVGVNPAKPPLVWEAWSGESWQPARVRSDDTGGLNRTGAIVLEMPARHESLQLGPEQAHWIRCRLVRATGDQTVYQTSPAISSLSASTAGGIVTARHARIYARERIGTSDGMPGQSFHVQHPPVLPRNHEETVEIVSPDGTVHRWAEARNLANASAEDRVFTWDASTGTVHFGPRIRYPDGTVRQFGAVPPVDAEVWVTTYRSGGGTRGNVGANTLTLLHTTVPFIDQVTNLEPARGGVDAETIENAKLRGAMTLRTGDRAVTAEDFERLATEADPAIARARTLPPSSPGEPVRLLLVPRVDDLPDRLTVDQLQIGNETFVQVASYLEERRLLGSAVEISPPDYQGVSVVARLQGEPGREMDLVRHRALMALYRFINPLTGGTDGQGWPFKRDLNVAQVFALLSDVEGVARVDEVLLFTVDLATGLRSRTGRQQLSLEEGQLFLSYRHIVV